MTRISVTQLARNLADVVNRVAYRGERFLVVRGNRDVAEIGPPPKGRPLSELPGILAALPRLKPEEVDSFEADLRGARESIRGVPQDPWS